jgi:copper chaperone CopZ
MVDFAVIGIKCESCVAKISTALKNKGFDDALVTLDHPQTVIGHEKSPSLKQVQESLAGLSEYKVTEVVSGVKYSEEQGMDSLRPLYIILSYVIGGVLLRAFISNEFSFQILMSNFMGGFLALFSLFKLLDLRGFVESYRSYDFLTARFQLYGFAYPFIELLLAVFYLTNFMPLATNYVTLILMLLGGYSVCTALMKKQKIRCACLGSTLQLPMTTVTLVENMVMAGMAVFMIMSA